MQASGTAGSGKLRDVVSERGPGALLSKLAPLKALRRSVDVRRPSSPSELLLGDPQGRRPSLRRFGPAESPRSPVLLVPPLMARSRVFDLHPRRSLVKYLRAQGRTVYMVDWGEPSGLDRERGLGAYVDEDLPSFTARAAEDSGQDLHLFGYCLGGLFCAWYLASEPESRVRSLTLVASPLDASKMGWFRTAALWTRGPGGLFLDVVGNVPGFISSLGFRASSPIKSATRGLDLLRNAGDEAFEADFVAAQSWARDFCAFPRRAFVELWDAHVVRNEHRNGGVTIDGRRRSLSQVRVPVLGFAGREDRIVESPALTRAAEYFEPGQFQSLEVPGGHAGLLIGSRAPAELWSTAEAFFSRCERGPLEEFAA